MKVPHLMLVWIVLLLFKVAAGQTATNPPTTTTNPATTTTSSATTSTPTTNAATPQQTIVSGGLAHIDTMEPAEVARGGSVTFRGQNFPPKEEIAVVLNGEKQDGAVKAVSTDRTSFVFAVPGQLALGSYQVRVDFKMNGQAVPATPTMPANGMLTIFSEMGKTQPRITAVYPLVSYPDKGQYEFDVVGEGFSERPEDNKLIIDQREIAVCWADKPCLSCSGSQPCPNNQTTQADQQGTNTNPQQTVEPPVSGQVINDHQLHFVWKPGKNVGGVKVQIRVGQNQSLPFDTTFSRVDFWIPKIVALVVLIVLFGVVLWLVSGGLSNVIAGRSYSIVKALFLDRETETYSLSKLQFFIWTAVAILAYLYLLLSRSLVQGKLEFVDVPTGIPGVVLVSAGTTVMAQAITNSKGPKGAGDIRPSLSDLVSTGGVVVPERFQFFVWTILGAAVFVFLVFLNDPGTIKDLPQVPSGFLTLMGVSSAGYLGGKLARKAGPVIDEIVTRFSSLEFTIKGRNLSKDAKFRIGGQDVTSDLIENMGPEILETEDQGEPNTGKLIRLTIKTPKPEWLKDQSTLAIVNPDGQQATKPYIVGPVVLPPVTAIRIADTQNVSVQIKGVNLSKDTTVILETNEGTPFPTAPQVEFKPPDTLQVLVSGLPFGVLVITNPDGRTFKSTFE